MKIPARVMLALVLLGCGDITGPSDRGPTLETLTPSSIPSGSSGATVVVSGRGFVTDSRIQVDGVDRATTFVSSRELKGQLSSVDLAASRALNLTVVNPGDLVSNALQLAVTNPAPQLDSVSPPLLVVGDSERVLVVHGRSFRANSVVRWNDVDRPTRYVSEDELEVDITWADVSVGARVDLSVYNPAPSGGTSAIQYLVKNPQPRVTGLSPSELFLDAPLTTVDVTGDNFVPGATVRLNGAPRATTYHSPNHLSFRIAGSDLTAIGPVALSVTNPDPALAASADSAFWARPAATHLVDLIAWDLAWDPVRNLVYASVVSSDPRYPNSVAAIDPLTGQIVAHVNVGTEPHQVAIADDASFLYVTLDGDAAVARVDLSSFTRDLVFTLGEGEYGTMYAQDIEVLPGHPHTVAISRVNLVVRSAQDGVALYDDGVPRPLAMPRLVGGNLIEFGTPTLLYGFNNEDTGFDIYRMDVTDSGLVLRDSRQGLVEDWYTDIRAGGGWVASTLGAVIDAETGWLAAKTGVIGLPLPEADGSRIYFFTHATLSAVSTKTWTLYGTKSMSAFPHSWYSPTRWGTDGFAYVGPTQVVVFRSDLVTRPLPTIRLMPSSTSDPTPQEYFPAGSRVRGRKP